MKTKYILATVFAWLFCVGVPLGATLSYFPLWIEQSATTTIAGGSVVLIILCAIPFFKQIKQWFRGNPASWVFWAIVTVVLFLLRSIIDQMIVVGLCAVGGNLIGDVLFSVAKKYREDKPDEGANNG